MNLLHHGGNSPPLALWLSKTFPEALLVRQTKVIDALTSETELLFEHKVLRPLRRMVSLAAELHGFVEADLPFGALEPLGTRTTSHHTCTVQARKCLCIRHQLVCPSPPTFFPRPRHGQERGPRAG